MPDYGSIFETLGVYARAFTQLDNLAERNLVVSESGEVFRSLDRLRQEFLDVLNDSTLERDRTDAVALLTDAAQSVRGWRAQLQQSLEAFVRGPLAAELGMRGAALPEVLAQLARAMHADEETIAPCIVALGAIAAAATNAGNAPLIVSVQTTNPGEVIIDDQRAHTQSIVVECTRDAARHRLPRGQEEFRVAPEFGPAVATRAIPVTVGDFPDTRNVIMDGAFDSHDGGFTYWAVHEGAGVFSRDATQKLFGAASLRLSGDGETAGDLRQDMAARDPALGAGRFFALGAWLRVDSLAAGSVTVDLLVEGEAVGALTVNSETPTGQWLHRAALVYLPRASFPNKVIARVCCSADFDGEVNVDGVSLAQATELAHAGLRLAIFQGSADPQAGPLADRWTIATTSDDAGAFQAFARDRLGLALPTDSEPSIDDQLAR